MKLARRGRKKVSSLVSSRDQQGMAQRPQNIAEAQEAFGTSPLPPATGG